jgi:hypothetical protein
MQLDLLRISLWATNNFLPLNPSKCYVMHFGLHNPNHSYFIAGSPIAISNQHLDLGILVDPSLKFHLNVDYVIAKVYKKAHYVFKKFTRTDPTTFTKLFKSFVRPVFEYCSQIARPCYPSYLEKLERCQRRLTKWCHAVRKLPYPERLKRLGLTSVITRFQRGDAILVFQIIHGLVNIDQQNIFLPYVGKTRGHNFRLQGATSRLNVRHRFFSERVINAWNSLPAHVVDAPTVNSFKARFDKHFALP